MLVELNDPSLAGFRIVQYVENVEIHESIGKISMIVGECILDNIRLLRALYSSFAEVVSFLAAYMT